MKKNVMLLLALKSLQISVLSKLRAAKGEHALWVTC